MKTCLSLWLGEDGLGDSQHIMALGRHDSSGSLLSGNKEVRPLGQSWSLDLVLG